MNEPVETNIEVLKRLRQQILDAMDLVEQSPDEDVVCEIFGILDNYIKFIERLDDECRKN